MEKKLQETQYQESPKLAVDLPEVRPCTAEFFVDWLIEYKGLPEESRENVISNLKRDYERVEFRGAMKQAAAVPTVTVNLSLFPRRKEAK